ncbi:hypothetical protein GTC6_08739 [Gordonia terrae C-6]|uniref:Uncharacterized protein n=1 Tax=Gordonia terrae C-6 TaxID=1316928 RepID=R7YAP9_9ACTN|nr:hypothetical protein GTC6_08739 [Gordonia terrae C-6]
MRRPRRRGCSSRRRPPIPARRHSSRRLLLRMAADRRPAGRHLHIQTSTPIAYRRCPISPRPRHRRPAHSARRCTPGLRPPIPVRPTGPFRRSSVPRSHRPPIPPLPRGRLTYPRAPDRITSAQTSSAQTSSAQTSSPARHRRPECRRTTSTHVSLHPVHPCPPRIPAIRGRLTSRCRRPRPVINRRRTPVPCRWDQAPRLPFPDSRCSTDTGRLPEARRSTRWP